MIKFLRIFLLPVMMVVELFLFTIAILLLLLSMIKVIKEKQVAKYTDWVVLHMPSIDWYF